MEISYLPIAREHLPGVMRLCQEEGWPSYAEDLEITWTVLTAPGVTSLVAVDAGEPVGVVQMQGDGHIQAHLSLLVVAKDYRRKGVGRRLVEDAFALCGGKRIDLLANDDAVEFYRSFYHIRSPGFRIYPDAGKDG